MTKPDSNGHGKKFDKLWDNLETVLGLGSCILGIYTYLAPIDFPCGFTTILRYSVVVILVILTLLGLISCFSQEQKISGRIAKIAVIVFAIVVILIGLNNFFIASSIEINRPEQAEAFYGLEISYEVKVCNLRQNENLNIVAEIQDPKTQLYKNFSIPYSGMTNPIEGKLQDPFFKDKELTMRFLLVGGGEKTVASSETRTFRTK